MTVFFNNFFYKLIFLFFIVSFQLLNSFRIPNFFKEYQLKTAYDKEDYHYVKETLQNDLVASPNDAKLNYNLGVVFYKLNKFKDAQNSFIRAAENSEKNLILKEKSYFNVGNSFYKGGLSILGDDWEKNDLQEEILNLAIKDLECAVDNYKNTLILDDKNEEAEKNKKLAEELLEKIKKKLLEKEKQDKKNDKNKQNKDREKQDKSQQGNGRHEKDKEKQDSQDNGQDEKKDNRQDGDDQNKENKEKKLDDQGEHDQQKDIRQAQSDRDEEEQSKGHEPQQKDSGSEYDEKQQASEMSFAQEVDQNNDMKEKGMLAMLQDLQADESKLQKMLMKSKAESKGKLGKGQKPW